MRRRNPIDLPPLSPMKTKTLLSYMPFALRAPEMFPTASDSAVTCALTISRLQLQSSPGCSPGSPGDGPQSNPLGNPAVLLFCSSHLQRSFPAPWLA